MNFFSVHTQIIRFSLCYTNFHWTGTSYAPSTMAKKHPPHPTAHPRVRTFRWRHPPSSAHTIMSCYPYLHPLFFLPDLLPSCGLLSVDASLILYLMMQQGTETRHTSRIKICGKLQLTCFWSMNTIFYQYYILRCAESVTYIFQFYRSKHNVEEVIRQFNEIYKHIFTNILLKKC
jgi:hypothetical protein